MVSLGLLYLAVEDFVLSDFSWKVKKPSSTKSNVPISRIVTGIQVSIADQFVLYLVSITDQNRLA